MDRCSLITYFSQHASLTTANLCCRVAGAALSLREGITSRQFVSDVFGKISPCRISQTDRYNPSRGIPEMDARALPSQGFLDP